MKKNYLAKIFSKVVGKAQNELMSELLIFIQVITKSFPCFASTWVMEFTLSWFKISYVKHQNSAPR